MIRDQTYLDTVDYIADLYRGMSERKRWRDGHGVVHELRPTEAYELVSGRRVAGGWHVTCGYKRRSDVEYDATAALTCFQCLGAFYAEQEEEA